MKRSYHGEAAMLYELSGDYELALSALQDQGDWKRLSIVALKMKYSHDRLKELYSLAAEKNKEKKCFADAGHVYCHYLGNFF